MDENQSQLNKILDVQKEFQKFVGFPIDSILEKDRNEMSEKFIFKLIEEAIEVRKEFPSIMNPWAKNQKDTNYVSVITELSDVFLFLVNLLAVWKISPSDFLIIVQKTQAENIIQVKKRKLDQLNNEILKVPTHVSGVGQGSVNPKYILIGQNPGKDIKHGYKFWSNPEDGSSKVLLPILEELGILPDCYFTNYVKSTTVDNKEPSKEDVDFWWPFLEREIRILSFNDVHPKIITMGKWTSKEFDDQFNGISHPASVLYGNLTKEEYKNEIKRAIE